MMKIKIFILLIIIIIGNCISNAKFERMINGLPFMKGTMIISVDKKLPNNVFCNVLGEIYHSSDYGETWAKVDSFKKVGGVTITNILAAYPMIIVVSDTYLRLSISNDYGITWRDIDTLQQKTTYGDTLRSVEYYSLFFLNDTVFIGASYGPFMSADNGIHWIPLYKGNKHNDRIFSIILKNNNLYIIANQNKIYYSTNMGDDWIEDKNLKLGIGWGPWELIIYNDLLLAWCTDTESIKLYSFNKYEEKWNLLITLKDTVLQNFKICNNKIYATGNQYGIFYSNDTGKTWIAYNDGFEDYDEKYGYRSVVGDVSENYLYAITNPGYEFKIYRAPLKDCEIVDETDVPEPDINRNGISIEIYPNPAAERITIKGYTPLPPPDRWGVVVEVYNVLGEIVKEIPLNPTFSKGEMEVDVSSLPPEMYYLSLKAGVERVTRVFGVVR